MSRFSIAILCVCTMLASQQPAGAQPIATIVAFERSANGNVGASPHGVANPGTFGLDSTVFISNSDSGDAYASGAGHSTVCDIGSESDADSSTIHTLSLYGTFGEAGGIVDIQDHSSGSAHADSSSPDTSASSNASDISNWALTFNLSAPALLDYTYNLSVVSEADISTGPGGSTTGAPLAHAETSLSGTSGIIFNKALDDVSGLGVWANFGRSDTICLQPGQYSLGIHVQNQANASAFGGACQSGSEADIVESGQTQVHVTLMLTPAVGPTIQSQPADAAACSGGAAGFSASATGSGVTYQWRHGGSALSDGPSGSGSSISGSTAPSLNITNISSADAGNYDCVVTAGCGSASSNVAVLTVHNSGSGDGNADGVANGRDIQGLVSFILHGGTPGASYCAYDLNADGVVNLTDVNLFVSRLLN